jgi:hypothetical protein
MGMLGRRLRGILIGLLLAIAIEAPASAADPGARFKRVDDGALISPDGRIHLEQYAQDRGDDGFLYQFWTFDGDHKHGFLLNRGEGTDLAGYDAGFRFSPDSQWLVRMQKLGAGYQTLFLYRREGGRFTAATRKPLGDLVWDYFFSLPVSKPMHRDPKDPYSLDHAQVGLVKGLEENYAWTGQHWPDSRYLVIGLSFDTQGEHPPSPWVEDWRCIYDLKTGTFSVPADFADNNARALKTADPDQK